jgi:hypothetical protein
MPTTGPLIDVSGVDFTIVFSEILGLIPLMLPVMLGFLAVRKGIQFIRGMMKGA